MQQLKQKQQQSETLALLTTVAVCVVGVVLWMVLWVGPRDRFLNEVLDCMGDDTSVEAYDRCAREIHERELGSEQ